MDITITRYDKNEHRCIGTLVMPEFTCYTLEDAEREEKIPGKTAIPVGRYEVVVSYSNRFKKMLPLLLDVPNFEGVRIHSGNSEADSSGCPLIGLQRSFDTITHSRAAMSKFMPLLMAALKKEKVFVVLSSLDT